MSGLPAWFTSITLGSLMGWIFAFAAMFATVWAITRPFRRASKAWEQFLEDWNGVPGRPGFPAIPGIPERLQTLESNADRDRTTLERIDHEMHPNSGGSMRDAVNKAVSDVDVVRREVEARMGEIPRLAADVAAVTRTLGNPRALRALASRLDREEAAADVPEPRTGGE